ncbi:hypothetical protein HDV05_002956 [Chytridiales sp. JEL 0842]|nr:hypothetical protein HDV05_002956 [Chytridiales sp. JEL 0842]
MAMFLIPCEKCHNPRDSLYFFPLENEFINTFDDDRYCQTCHECIAKRFNKLNCTECFEFRSQNQFSPQELKKGIQRVCKKCEKVPEEERDNNFMLKDKSGCRTCGKEAEDTKLMKCGNCGRVYYCSAECQKKDWKLQHKNECQVQARIVERFTKEGRIY